MQTGFNKQSGLRTVCNLRSVTRSPVFASPLFRQFMRLVKPSLFQTY